MPTVSRFHGLEIKMHFKEHSPPHFHVWSAGDEAQVRIHPVEVMNGKLDRKQFALVKKWAELHRKELEANWNRARARGTLMPIKPWT
jgi:hypothetical protein